VIVGRLITGFITERGPDSVRGPDIAYWSKERLTEVPVGKAVINSIELRMVESVEGLESKLELDLFGEREILKE
jgi:hypothetical protein